MQCRICGHENEAGSRFCSICGNPLAADETFGPQRRTSFGPYTILGEIGRGAMAVVWRAWDTNLEREVAIKEPLFDPRLSEAARAEMGRRFLREGRAAARLAHPNIVAIHSADIYGGAPVIVMELVEGYTLSQVLDQGPLVPEIALALLDQLLDAAGYAHDQGVIHRDIKPDNIYVTSRGALKLGDFGIAHLDDAGTMGFTVVGSVLGTPGYMSPEQVLGLPVDARSDLFSIGVVAYEMLTGQNPFGATDGAGMAMLLHRIAYEPVRPVDELLPPTVPQGMCQAIMAALEKDSGARPQSASELKAMLHGYGDTWGARAADGTVQVRGEKPSPVATPRAGTTETMAQTEVVEAPYGGTQGPASQPTALRRLMGGSACPWLPYAIVAALGALLLGFALSSALGGLGGGAGFGTTTVAGGARQQGAQVIDYDKMPRRWVGTYVATSRSFVDAMMGVEMEMSLDQDDDTVSVVATIQGEIPQLYASRYMLNLPGHGYSYRTEAKLQGTIDLQTGSIRLEPSDSYWPWLFEDGIDDDTIEYQAVRQFSGVIDPSTWTIVGEASLPDGELGERLRESFGVDLDYGLRPGRWTMTAVHDTLGETLSNEE